MPEGEEAERLGRKAMGVATDSDDLAEAEKAAAAAKRRVVIDPQIAAGMPFQIKPTQTRLIIFQVPTATRNVRSRRSSIRYLIFQTSTATHLNASPSFKHHFSNTNRHSQASTSSRCRAGLQRHGGGAR